MHSDDFNTLHRRLRRELEAAYAARPWDVGRIESIARITQDLLRLERSYVAEKPLPAGAAQPPARAARPEASPAVPGPHGPAA